MKRLSAGWLGQALWNQIKFPNTLLVLAICCGRDGNLSSLHRHMVNQFGPLCRLTHQEDHRPISRAQLSLLLAKVNGALLAKLLFEWFGLLLTPAQQGWFALDGKDLRGSISKGKTRGEACVSVLNHESQQLIGQAYYSGDKDSEKLVIRQLLEDENLLSEQITLNALHLNPLTVSAIHMTSGRYSIGLKANQPLLHC